LRKAEGTFSRLARTGSKKSHYGRVLFDDEFDGTMENWEVVTATGTGDELRVEDMKPALGDTSAYARIQQNVSSKKYSPEVVPSCVVLDTQHGPDRFVGIRSKKPVEADRFVVEIRFGCNSKKPPERRRGRTDISDFPLAGREDVPDAVLGEPVIRDLSLIWLAMHRWEFTPAPEKGPGVFLCRRHWGASKRDSKGEVKWSSLGVDSWYVRPKSRLLLFGICGPDWDLVVDRVTVREFPEETAGDGENLQADGTGDSGR